MYQVSEQKDTVSAAPSASKLNIRSSECRTLSMKVSGRTRRREYSADTTLHDIVRAVSLREEGESDRTAARTVSRGRPLKVARSPHRSSPARHRKTASVCETAIPPSTMSALSESAIASADVKKVGTT